MSQISSVSLVVKEGQLGLDALFVVGELAIIKVRGVEVF